MRMLTTWMLVASIIFSPSVTYSADSNAPQKAELRNVKLAENGTLEGQLLDQSGSPIANSAVVLRSQTNLKEISLTLKTDASGRFAVDGLRNGVCVLDAGNESFAFRIWDSKTAPPNSLTSVALVHGDSVTRGQECCEQPGMFESCKNRIRCMSPAQKLGLGLIIAAAIIIPIALDDDDAS